MYIIHVGKCSHSHLTTARLIATYTKDIELCTSVYLSSFIDPINYTFVAGLLGC